MQVDYHAHWLNRSELDVNSPSVMLEAFVNDHVKQHVNISSVSRRRIQTPWKAGPHVSLHPVRQALSCGGYIGESQQPQPLHYGGLPRCRGLVCHQI
jgi:hypothetical protein